MHFNPPVVHQPPVLVLDRLSNSAAHLFELELHYLLGLVHNLVEVPELVVGNGHGRGLQRVGPPSTLALLLPSLRQPL